VSTKDRLTVEVIGPHQTRPPEWPREVTELADELEAVLAAGADGLPAIVAALNARGGRWTESALRQRLAELGA
jgi:hypothetical protein